MAIATKAIASCAEALVKSTPYLPVPTTKLTFSKVRPDTCNPTKKEGKLLTQYYAGEKYWKLEGEAVAPGYPRSIYTDWQGLPGNIDAAFTWTNGHTYFFKVIPLNRLYPNLVFA